MPSFEGALVYSVMQAQQLPPLDPFWQTEQVSIELPSGKQTSLPCHFYDVHYLVALFKVSKGLLQTVLAGTGLHPGLQWKGNDVLALGLIQYRNSDLGAYNEIIFSVPAMPQTVKPSLLNWAELFGPLDSRKLGQFVFHIPVSSAFSFEAGQEIWGFPKRVADIAHQFTAGKVDSCMHDADHGLVLQCRGSLGFSIPMIPLSLITYTRKDGKLFKTPVKVRGTMRYYPRQQLVLRAGDSNDPIATDIRRLGLDGKSPFIVMDSPKFQAKFMQGQPC